MAAIDSGEPEPPSPSEAAGAWTSTTSHPIPRAARIAATLGAVILQTARGEARSTTRRRVGVALPSGPDGGMVQQGDHHLVVQALGAAQVEIDHQVHVLAAAFAADDRQAGTTDDR